MSPHSCRCQHGPRLCRTISTCPTTTAQRSNVTFSRESKRRADARPKAAHARVTAHERDARRGTRGRARELQFARTRSAPSRPRAQLDVDKTKTTPRTRTNARSRSPRFEVGPLGRLPDSRANPRTPAHATPRPLTLSIHVDRVDLCRLLVIIRNYSVYSRQQKFCQTGSSAERHKKLATLGTRVCVRWRGACGRRAATAGVKVGPTHHERPSPPSAVAARRTDASLLLVAALVLSLGATSSLPAPGLHAPRLAVAPRSCS